MSEVKNTPGPWRTHISEGRGHLCVISDDAWICGEIHRPGGGMPRAEAEANASLIAAAPDMLAALKQAETALDYVYRGSDDLRIEQDLSAVRAAIAKAEKRSP